MPSKLSPESTPPNRTPATSTPEQFSVFGITVELVTEGDVVEQVIDRATRGAGGSVCSVNLDTLRQGYESPHVAGLLNSADLRVADGMPIVWAGRVAGLQFPERVSGSNLVPAIARRAAATGLSVYFLGGNPGAAERVAELLRAESPALQVAGIDCPPYGYEKNPAEVASIHERVTAAKPDIVFVALSFLKQEELIRDLRAQLPNTWFIGCGITFSFIVGEVRRAPKWMQDAGLEWLHRFSQEPRKLFRRYFLQDVPFLVTLMRAAVRQRLRRGE